MDTYYRRTPPEDLTLLERLEWEEWAAKAREVELDKTLAHYREQLRLSAQREFMEAL